MALPCSHSALTAGLGGPAALMFFDQKAVAPFGMGRPLKPETSGTGLPATRFLRNGHHAQALYQFGYGIASMRRE